MQFVKGGPDVPERLVQAHEEGRVVFFCGAGISYPAGLPGFAGLVNRVYDEVGEAPFGIEPATLKSKSYDTTLGLLEARLAPHGQGRDIVRRAVAKILTATSLNAAALRTHEALLTLAQSRHGPTRLVTTNFDRLFEEVIDRDRLVTDRFHAPLFPVPKSRWNGLVYLHGLLTQRPTNSELDRLVLSSGDFGLAYLTERWAARFVSELFRNFNVCFVGYSISDPVLRYMMDALAADRLLGEAPPEMFAFGSYSKGKQSEQEAEWRAKNVTPILYKEHQRHALLHRTLSSWASTYRDGVGGKEQVVALHSSLAPQTSTREEDFVGRLIWAISDSSGLPAKRFAEAIPTPPFDWVEHFMERRFGRDDLNRFGVTPLSEIEEKRVLASLSVTDALRFSLLHRPAPYLRAPYMSLARNIEAETDIDNVMYQLARWMLRYLDEPKLILWLAKNGAGLSRRFAWLIEERLRKIAAWEKGKSKELDELRTGSPQSIPREVLRPLWRLLLTGRIKTANLGFGLYGWFDQFKGEGLTASLRFSLREALKPRISLREPFGWGDGEDEEGGSERLNRLVGWDLVLSSDHVHSALRNVARNTPAWAEALPELLEDATTLLRDAMDLVDELGGTGEFSYIHQPSIAPHAQNRDFRDWTALIDLARDSWTQTAARDPSRARVAAAGWKSIDYPIFQRLALFAATHSHVVPLREAVEWLLSDDRKWLWSNESEREAIRLLVSIGPRLADSSYQDAVEEAILAGPTRAPPDNEDQERWQEYVAHEVWLRLAKLEAAGLALGPTAAARLAEISQARPVWKLEPDDRDEFAFWMGAGSRRTGQQSTTPRKAKDLATYLDAHPEEDDWNGDDWSDRCKDDFAKAAAALMRLASQNKWPESRWRRALQVWADERHLLRSWRWIAPTLEAAPDDFVTGVSHALASWLEKVAKVFPAGGERRFFAFANRLLSSHYEEADWTDDPVTKAINHPLGRLTQGLLDWWYRRELKNDQLLPAELAPFFTRLCDPDIVEYRNGRVLLAANCINLYLVDPEWTTRSLLPFFNWEESAIEAKAAWEGFLWSPRLVRSHLAAIKRDLLETADHYDQLGDHDRQFAAFLTFVALDRGETFSAEELRQAFRKLPEEGLSEAATSMVRGLEGAGDQKSFYFENRIKPFWRQIWPKTAQPSVQTSDDLFRLCVTADGEFPNAVELVKAWLIPVPHPDYLVGLLEESKLCARFPADSLAWLDHLIDAQPWPPRDLRDCLNDIVAADNRLENDPRYRRLDEYCRQHGM